MSNFYVVYIVLLVQLNFLFKSLVLTLGIWDDLVTWLAELIRGIRSMTENNSFCCTKKLDFLFESLVY